MTPRAGIAALTLFAILVAARPPAALAATITVGPNCTLAQAIEAANGDAAVGGCAAGSGADVIDLPFGAYGVAVAHDGGANAFPPVSSAITLLGHGATITRTNGTAPPFFRFFEVVAGGDLTLRDLTLEGGSLLGLDVTGGAVRANGAAALTLDTVTIRNNRVESNVDSAARGGGVFVAGGATLAVIDSVVRGNVAIAPTGSTGGQARGGGIYLDSDTADLAISGSTIADNTASATAIVALINKDSRRGIAQGGGLWIETTKSMLLRDSRVTGNLAAADGIDAGAGGTAQGGGVRYLSGTGNLTVLRSVISHNTASANAGPVATAGDGGLATAGGLRTSTNGAVQIADSSLNGNTATGNGGGFVRAPAVSLTSNAAAGGLDYAGRGTLDVLRSSVSSNTVSALSGPGRPAGGANAGGVRIDGSVQNDPFVITFTSTTVANNTVMASGVIGLGTAGAGFVRGGGVQSNDSGTVTLLNTTITGNSASGLANATGGGLLNTQASTQYFLRDTILSGNSAAIGPNCGDTPNNVGYVSQGTNILGSLDGCDLVPDATDLVDVSPGLGPFTDSGAPAGGYFPLATGSAARGAGALCAPSDQLGQGWPASCDIGAIGVAPQGIPLLASLLPIGRAGQLGTSTLTAFATVINVGTSPAYQVRITQGAAPVPAAFHFQTTDPATNALTGSPDAPVDVPPGGVQTFVISLRATAPFAPTDLALRFAGVNSQAAPSIPGLSTLLVSADVAPIADVVALAATPTQDGIARIPGPNGTGLFSVASVNLGAPSVITVRASTGATTPAPTILVCQTVPATGACIGTPAPEVTTAIGANETPTFAFFVIGNGAVALDPANHRGTVLFVDAQGQVRGATGVALMTE